MLKSFEKEKTCRACTKTSTDLSSIFSKQDTVDGVGFSDMITECTIYTVQEDDELPHLICSDCKDKVRIAYCFKKQCEESHRRLLSMIQAVKNTSAEEEPTLFKDTHPANVTPSNLGEQEKETETQDETNLRKKSTRNTPSQQHSCDKCSQIFTKQEHLDEHIKNEHKNVRHTCPGCSKEFVRLGHLKRHLTKVHESVDIPGEKSKEEVSVKSESLSVIEPEITLTDAKVNSDAEDLDFDFGTDNENDNTYQDDTESLKSVKDEKQSTEDKPKTDEVPLTQEEHKEKEDSTIKEENLDETEKPSKSAKPDESQKPEDDLQPPMKKGKSSKFYLDTNRKFKCEQCHKAFKRKSHLTQHTLCHTKVKPYQCTICQKRFGRPDNLKVHMSNHGQKHFQCTACDRSFGQAYLLKRHKDQTHSEDKPFLCSQCGQRFVRNGDLAVHMRRHSGEKPYKCQYCNKGFTRSTEVYVHERYHTGEKKHVCTICGKAFQRPYNLLVHVRTHTGERPYQCPHCPKNFAQCSDLKAHIRRHTGERYRCDQCGMGFIHVFVLNQHKFSVHGIEVQSRIKRVAKLSTDTP